MSSFSNCNLRFVRAHKGRIVLAGLEQILPTGMSIPEDQEEKQRIILGSVILAVRTLEWEGHNQCKSKTVKSFREFPTAKVIRIKCNNSRKS